MQVVQIVLWYLDSGCSKLMTEDCSQLINFVQKFLSTVKFGNDHVAKIMGYGDYKIGNASKTKSWLWHHRLSHLNFGAINHLARQGLVLVQADSIGLPSSTSVDQDAPSPSKSHTTPETQSSVIPQDVKEDNIDIEVARMGNDPLFGVPIPEIISDQSSSTVSLHTIVQTDHQIPQHISKWTKDHPPDNIIDQLSRPVSIRFQLHEQALFCYYDAFLTSVEPKTYKDALTQSC
nr:integrase, catalytic region, zinc finger, CCHC-type, peptidase aspartic, catalytic [Tanacetum cinerariifolium]